MNDAKKSIATIDGDFRWILKRKAGLERARFFC